VSGGGTLHGGTWPRVTIVIPLFNVERYVGEAIDSVLAQTLPADQLEVVVVNDGSTDGSADIAERYVPRVRHIRQENRGLAAARNVGLRVARGEFVGFLDADDRLLPEKLAAQLAVFDARPDVGVVYTGLRYIDEAGRPLPQAGWARLPPHPVADFVLSNRVAPHLPLVRRADVERVGAFDESMSPAADWDLWLRLARGARGGLRRPRAR
jgi:glycosyltransferase involved in cell wall biosynthesis